MMRFEEREACCEKKNQSGKGVGGEKLKCVDEEKKEDLDEKV